MAGSRGTPGATPGAMSNTEKKIFDDLKEECADFAELWHVTGEKTPWRGRTRVGRGLPRRREETQQPTIESLASWARAWCVKPARDAEE